MTAIRGMFSYFLTYSTRQCRHRTWSCLRFWPQRHWSSSCKVVRKDWTMVFVMPLTLAFQTPYLFTHLWSNHSILLYTLHLVGLWETSLGLELFSETNPYTTSPLGISPQSADWSLTRSSMGRCWNQFSAPLRWMWCQFIPTIPTSCMLLIRLFYPSVPLRNVTISFHATLTKG